MSDLESEAIEMYLLPGLRRELVGGQSQDGDGGQEARQYQHDSRNSKPQPHRAQYLRLSDRFRTS